MVSHERTVTAAFVPFLLVLSWLACRAGASARPPSAADLARNLQRKYEQVRDFSADFEHVYEGGVLRKKVTERGTLLVKKPGMMRWTYTSPEKKEFVSDGRTLYSYVPEDQQVIVSAVPPADEASSPALFLAGKGNIQRDFTPRLAAAAGLAAVGGRPRSWCPGRRSASTTGSSWSSTAPRCRSGGWSRPTPRGEPPRSSSRSLRENVGLPDKAFTFTIPRGVDVVTDGSRTVDRPAESTAPRAGRAVLKAVLRPAAALALASLAAACATTSALRKGRDAEQAQDYDRAVAQYTKALKEKPDNADAQDVARAGEAAGLRVPLQQRPAACRGRQAGGGARRTTRSPPS